MNLIENSLSNIDYLPLVRNLSDTNKGDFGSVLIIGGNTGMLGSIHLAGRSAMLMGAGRVVLAPIYLQHDIDIMMPELMIKSLSEVLHILNQFTAIVIGPGFGIDEYAQSILTQILEYPYSPTSKLIFDADALNLIATHENLRAKFINLLPFNKVITPHKGEAMRLLSDKYNAVKDSRVDVVKTITQMYQCITLLKGHESLIYSKNAPGVFINKTGNQALSSAGQGDTLSGLIAGLAAQGISLITALQFAVYLHGLAADNLVTQHAGYNGLLASEVALGCRDLLNKILYTKDSFS
jgi:hydroxyethylthiazole kinase-like uncharacterized protein yjeF